MRLLAKTYYGMEECLAEELTELGADNIEISNRAVFFEGDKRLMYQANLQLHTALRVLRPVYTFKATSADEVYEQLKKFDFTTIMSLNNTFIINETVNSETMHNSQFVKYRAKDAIVDFFNERFNKRPNVSVQNPDICFDLHVSHDMVTLSLDASGDSLHLRGWRVDQTVAPISEVLAAGMLKIAGWKGQSDFIDPMCGSGTLLIEAALMALNMAPCLYRQKFAFEKWSDFDADLFEEVYNDDSMEREFEHHIYGYDVDAKAVLIAQRNVKAAGLSKYITIEQRDIKDMTEYEGKALMVTNPPYGKRIVTDYMFDLYRSIGTALKHKFVGNTAWVISSEKTLLAAIGMKPSAKYKMINGALECQFCRFEVFAGKHDDFVRERREHGEAKNEEKHEKRDYAKVREYSKVEHKPRPDKGDNPKWSKTNKNSSSVKGRDRSDRARFFESKKRVRTEKG